jgi:O-methyltransferase involved in polyketide biosynthesis
MPQKPSHTAHTVLAGTWLTYCSPDRKHLVSPEIGEWAGQALRALGHPYSWLLRSAIARQLAYRAEAKVLPGVCTHYGARKTEIQRLVTELNPAALVVLGAGFDGLAARLSGQTRSVEIDQPETQQQKARLLQRLGNPPVALIPGDANDLADTLPELPADTVVVIEGMLMYLPPERIGPLLSELRPVARNLIVTLMDLDGKGRPAFGGSQDQVDRFLAQAKEPFLSGYRPAEVPGLFAAAGWEVQSMASHENIPGMIAGEYIVHAR